MLKKKKMSGLKKLISKIESTSEESSQISESTQIGEFSIKINKITNSQIEVDVENKIEKAVGYAIWLDTKVVGLTETLPYTIKGLKQDSYYAINVTAIDNGLAIKHAKTKLSVKTAKYMDGIVDWWDLKNDLNNKIDNGVGNLVVCKGNVPEFTEDGAYLNNIVLSTQDNYSFASDWTMAFQIKATKMNKWSWVIGKKESMVNSTLFSGVWVYNADNRICFGASWIYGSDAYNAYKVNETSTLVLIKSDSTLSLYSNGKLIKSVTEPISNCTAKFYIGGSQLSGEAAGAGITEGYSPGYYKNVIVFNRAISSDEVEQISNMIK